jgi:hypothetical protein
MGNLSLAYADLKAVTVLQPGNADAKREMEMLEKQNVELATITPTNPQPTVRNADPDKKTETPPKSNNPDVAKNNTPPATNPVSQPVQQTTTTASGVAQALTLAEFFKDEKRYALVIGNSNYPKEIGTLKNPSMMRRTSPRSFKLQTSKYNY